MSLGGETSSVPNLGDRSRYAGERSIWVRLWMVGVAAAAFIVVALLLSSGLGLIDMARWAAAQQRAFHGMVQKLLAMDGGSTFAVMTLVGACFAYGFIHAAVPGHGKFLIAGAGLATRMSAVRLVALSLAAAMAQAVTALVLVYGSFTLLDITAGWAQIATDRVLVPLSYVAIVIISAVLIRRAIRGLQAATGHHHHHAHGADGAACSSCGHRHGPTPEEAARVSSWREALMLILGIGLRPCTGAVFVLVAAWRLDLIAVGAAATVAMALGTGAFISLIAVSAVTARGATLFSVGQRYTAVAVPVLQLFAGLAILVIALAFLVGSLLPAA